MTTLVVRDNATKKEVARESSHNMAKMFVAVDTLRRQYKNSTVEMYYGKVEGKPVSQYKSFDCLPHSNIW